MKALTKQKRMAARVIGLALILGCTGRARTEEAARLVVGFWNVENLFDTVNDPENKGDDGYLPGGWMRWTQARYALKLAHLAAVIAQMNPDVLGLAEIENRVVLEDLARVLRERHGVDFRAIVHRDGMEKRGIDVALMARQKPVETRWLQPVPGQREVLVCRFVCNDRPLTVLVNHWKSQIGKQAACREIRGKEAVAVRTWLDRMLRADPAAAILVTGDFNDNPESPVLVEQGGLVLDEARVRADSGTRLLLNLTAWLPVSDRATYYYEKGDRWQTLDAIHATRGMLSGCSPASPWRVSDGGYRIVRSVAQCWMDGTPIPFRRKHPRTPDEIYVTGFSDHFPVRVVLEAHTP